MKFCQTILMICLLTLSANAQQGLKVDYFEGRNFDRFIGSRTETKLDLKWDRLGPLPNMGPSEFSARIKGLITVPVSGNYTFSVRVDDGFRLSIGGVKLFNTWQDNDHVSLRRKLYLEKDRYYAIEAEYYNGILEGELVLIWELPQNAPESLKRSWQGTVSANWFSQTIPLDRIRPKTEMIVIPEKKSELIVKNKAPIEAPVLQERKPISPPKKKEALVVKPKPAIKPVKLPKQVAVTKPKPRTTEATKSPIAPRPKPRVTVQNNPLPDSLIVLSQRTASRIGFVKSKAELLPASFPGLDSLAQKLNRYPFIQVEINGHTDYIGDSTNNAKLSFKRAQAVASYLIEKGIEESRLKVQGFGGKFPLSFVDTEAEHNRNRRVEIRLYR